MQILTIDFRPLEVVIPAMDDTITEDPWVMLDIDADELHDAVLDAIRHVIVHRMARAGYTPEEWDDATVRVTYVPPPPPKAVVLGTAPF